jgi:hypothetical protein
MAGARLAMRPGSAMLDNLFQRVDIWQPCGCFDGIEISEQPIDPALICPSTAAGRKHQETCGTAPSEASKELL